MQNQEFEIPGGHAPLDAVTFVGVDGCRGGWFCVGFSGAGAYRFDVWPDFPALIGGYPNAQLILVDIPIGLPGPKENRACDDAARRKLGQLRASSVFWPPLREVMNLVVGGGNYDAANLLTRQMVGRGLTRQSYALIPRIAEVDAVMINRGHNINPAVREVHPEVCFWALNGGNAMVYSKHELRGILERIQVMAGFGFNARGLPDAAYNQIPGRVAFDDFCDALVAAITAFHGHDQLHILGQAGQQDPVLHLPMELVYWQP
jgi:predicted RNase H-like nuclease